MYSTQSLPIGSVGRLPLKGAPPQYSKVSVPLFVQFSVQLISFGNCPVVTAISNRDAPVSLREPRPSSSLVTCLSSLESAVCQESPVASCGSE
eukprot:2058916-Prymnesium_polylepis.2